MTWPQILLLVLVGVPLLLVNMNRLRMDVAALLIAVLLGILQALGVGLLGPAGSPDDAVKSLAGLAQPAIITLLSLFIITRCLDKTGVTQWIARRLLAVGGNSERRLIVLFAAATAAMSLFMNNLAAGALLLPSALEASRRTGIRPSKLLIPVAYGSLLGGSATYFTTANIIVSNLLTSANPPQEALHILDFTPTGGLIALAGLAFFALFGPKLLPDRMPSTEQLLARPTGSDLEDIYRLGSRLWEVGIRPDSPLAGQTLAQMNLGERLGLAVIAIWHGRQAIFTPQPDQVVHADDLLLVVGRAERVEQLVPLGMSVGRNDASITQLGVAFIEVMLAPHSQIEGQTLKQIEFRKRYGFTAVALRREGQSYRTDVADFPMRLGDTFLVVGPRTRLAALRKNSDFIVLEPDLRDLPVQQPQAALSIGVIVGAIVLAAFGFPDYLAVLAGALLLILVGVVSMEEAYRAVEWQALFLIAGMYAVSQAMVSTGLADLVGTGVVHLVAPFGALGLVAGAYLLTSALTQIMGGQVAVLVTGPILISAAISANISPQAIAVAAAIGCSASFFTPIAHPVNILMVAPANYTFGDFFRIGWPLTIVSFVMLLIGMSLFWQL